MDGTTPPDRSGDDHGVFSPDSRRQTFRSNTCRCTETVVNVAVKTLQQSGSSPGCRDLFFEIVATSQSPRPRTAARPTFTPRHTHHTDHISGLKTVQTFWRLRLPAGKCVLVHEVHLSGTAPRSSACKNRHLWVQHGLGSAFTDTGSIDPARLGIYLPYAVVLGHSSGQDPGCLSTCRRARSRRSTPGSLCHSLVT
jgi:hypothetical protein